MMFKSRLKNKGRVTPVKNWQHSPFIFCLFLCAFFPFFMRPYTLTAEPVRVIVMFTSGFTTSATDSQLTLEDVIYMAINRNVTIHMVGIGAEVNTTALSFVAQSTGGQFIPNPSSSLELFSEPQSFDGIIPMGEFIPPTHPIYLEYLVAFLDEIGMPEAIYIFLDIFGDRIVH